MEMPHDKWPTCSSGFSAVVGMPKRGVIVRPWVRYQYHVTYNQGDCWCGLLIVQSLDADVDFESTGVF